jgi:hypothetical protein
MDQATPVNKQPRQPNSLVNQTASSTKQPRQSNSLVTVSLVRPEYSLVKELTHFLRVEALRELVNNYNTVIRDIQALTISH